MKTQFKEFYSSEKIDFNKIKDDTLVVFDTNSLLNIYRYSKDVSEKFLQAVQKINKNIWIPYQVGLEFNLNRKTVMREVAKAPEVFRNGILKEVNSFENQVNNLINQYVIKSVDAKDVKTELKDKFKKTLRSLVDNFLNEDFTNLSNLIKTEEESFNRLIGFLDGKVGLPYEQERINEIVKNGEERYKLSIPPGYADEKVKKENSISFNGITYPAKYGDLIVWNQIIDKSASDKNINKVVFITDDNKPDWWYFIGTERIGPRAELKNEMIRIGKAELIMINSNSFIQQMEDTLEDLIEEPKDFFFVFDDEINNDDEKEDEIYNNDKMYFLGKLDNISSMIQSDLNLPSITDSFRVKAENDLEIFNILKKFVVTSDSSTFEKEQKTIIKFLRAKEMEYFGI